MASATPSNLNTISLSNQLVGALKRKICADVTIKETDEIKRLKTSIAKLKAENEKLIQICTDETYPSNTCDCCDYPVYSWDKTDTCYHCGTRTACFTWHKEKHASLSWGVHCTECHVYCCDDCIIACGQCSQFYCPAIDCINEHHCV